VLGVEGRLKEVHLPPAVKTRLESVGGRGQDGSEETGGDGREVGRVGSCGEGRHS